MAYQIVPACIDTADGGDDCQLQLWIESVGSLFYFVIRSQYQPGGKIVRRCALQTGACVSSYESAEVLGRLAMEKHKGPTVQAPAGEVQQPPTA